MNEDPRTSAYSPLAAPREPLPSWVVGVCGVAAVASTLFSILLFLNR